MYFILLWFMVWIENELWFGLKEAGLVNFDEDPMDA